MEEGTIFGYVRVSTKDQNGDRQLLALLERGVPEENILTDKQSGKDFNRPQYQRLIKMMKPGDTLFVKSVDRLGRNYDEITNQWRIITKELQVFIVVLDIPLLDTRVKGRDLTGVFIADLVLQILSYVAQTERELIRQRQAEGISVAQSKGVRFGRPPLERSALFYELCHAWFNQKTTTRSAANRLGISPRTFSNWAKESFDEITQIDTMRQHNASTHL